ncbi:hypothetical protein F2P79_015202, partial [Pimephales promelas]
DAGWPSVDASMLPRTRWTATAPRVPWADGRSPPLPAPPLNWRMAAGSGPRQVAVTPPLPPGRQPPLHSQAVGGELGVPPATHPSAPPRVSMAASPPLPAPPLMRRTAAGFGPRRA